MAEIYFDNDVSLDLAPLFIPSGHRVTTTRDLVFFRASDDAQLLTAARNRWILVTYNRRDFTMLHDAWLTWPAAFGVQRPPHSGILALNHAPVDEQSSAVLRLLGTAPAVPLANRMFWWHRRDGWRRRVVSVGWDSDEF